LRGLGYSYPIFRVPPGHAPSNHTFFINTHFSSLIRDRRGSIPLLSFSLNSQRKQRQDQLRGYLNNFDGNLILASERISTLTAIELEELNRFFCELGFSVKAFCCIREPTEWLNSIIAQRIAGIRGPRLDLNSVISEFLDQKSLIVNRLKNLQLSFSDMCFYPFKQAVIHPQGVAGFFFETLELNILVDNFYLNHSASNHAVRLLSKINQAIRSGEIDSNPFSSNLISQLIKMPGSKFSLSASELAPLKHIINYENEWLTQVLGTSYCDHLDSKIDPEKNLNERERYWLTEAIRSSNEDPIKKIIGEYLEFF